MTSKAAHVVVIGAGIGGLSAALAMCCHGATVTVVEQSNVTGGKMHQTTVDGVPIDSGPTVLTMRGVFDQLFSRAGMELEEHVALIKANHIARHFWHGDQSLDLYTCIDQTSEAISQFSSPKEAQNYRAFAAKAEALFHALDLNFMRAQRPGTMQLGINATASELVTILRSPPFTSLWRALSRSFNDPRLQQLFARYSTYCGSSPFKAPATLMLIAHAERAGLWICRDGMQSLAHALEAAILAKGGEIRLSTGISQITCSNKAVSGVVTANGEVIKTDAVIYNGDPAALGNGLLSEAVRRATPKQSEASLSAYTLCTNTKVTHPALAYHNVFFGNHYKKEFDAIFNKGELAQDPTIYVCAQDRLNAASFTYNNSHEQHSSDHSNTERLFCLMNAAAQTVTNNEIQHATDTLKQTLCNHGLELPDTASSQVIATPNSFSDRFPGSKGALYGQPTHGWMGSFKRPGSRSKVAGLYLAGGGVHPGAGLPMVSLSGQLAADQLAADLAR